MIRFIVQSSRRWLLANQQVYQRNESMSIINKYEVIRK